MQAKHTTSTVIPSFRYRDAAAAIDWLCRAFGFTEHLVVAGEGATIAHAQLAFGNGMIMLGSQREPAPEGAGGVYVIVDDADAHHARAKASGARIVQGPEDQPHGGRLYSCLDPEGHVWHFGTYDPWA